MSITSRTSKERLALANQEASTSLFAMDTYISLTAYGDEEGVRIMRTLANNTAYLIKCKHQSNIELPEELPVVMTNLVR